MGHTLLTEVEKEVRGRDGRLLLVETSSTGAYDRARHLYETGGYRREAFVHDFYAPGDDLLIYVKDLQADRGGPEVATMYQGALACPIGEAPVAASP